MVVDTSAIQIVRIPDRPGRLGIAGTRFASRIAQLAGHALDQAWSLRKRRAPGRRLGGASPEQEGHKHDCESVAVHGRLIVSPGGGDNTGIGHFNAPLGPGTLRAPMRVAIATLLAPLLLGCPSVPPPPSRLPDADSAIARLRATGGCGTGLQAAAKIDHFGEHGRVRGDLLMFASEPARIRMDIVSPFGVTLATLTSDGSRFSLFDMRNKHFYVGRATACNIARLTTVPIPGHVLVELLRGQAPVLKHAAGAGAIGWSGKGYYVVTIPGTRNATEEIHLTPQPDDFNKPWTAQRMRLLDVVVHQYGEELYRAELDGHARAAMAKERVDPDGIDPPVPPSGPFCEAELPRRIHVEVPGLEEDVLFRYDDVTWNPPLPEGTFMQPVPPGVPVEQVECE